MISIIRAGFHEENKKYCYRTDENAIVHGVFLVSGK